MRVSALLSLLLALVLIGCRFESASPDLITVHGLSPRHLDVGDQLEMVGSGFPEGKTASITFRGDLYRAGREPVRATKITATVARTSQSRASLVLSELLQYSFCGFGADARHTTFRGDVVIAFSPLKAGAPPVTGTLRDVALSIAAPPLPREAQQSLQAETERALQFLGITLGERSAAGLALRAVDPQGRMARAGILEGDQLRGFGGMLVRDASDLIPPGTTRFVLVDIRRGRHESRRRVEVQGFNSAAPSELAWAAVLVGFAAALVLLFVAPAAGIITWAERVVARRLLANSGRRVGPARGLAAWLRHTTHAIFREEPLPAGDGVLVLRLVPYLLLVAVSAAFTLLAFGVPLVSEDLDLGLLFTASSTAMVAVGLILGGWRAAGRWSLLAGLGSAVQILCFQLPALTGIACVVIMAGSARFGDIVFAQGGLPWQWYLFKNPTLLVTFLLLLATALPETSRAPAELPEADGAPVQGTRLRHPASRCLMFFAEWGHAFILSGFATVLFLGGWRVPAVSATEQQATVHWQILGAVLFQAKCWLIVLVVLWTRWVLPRIRVDQMMGLCWRYFMPLGFATLGLTTAWVAGLKSPVLHSTQSLLSIVTFALCVFVGAYFVRRVGLNLRNSEAQLNVNPWL